jgi:hypothetical protein
MVDAAVALCVEGRMGLRFANGVVIRQLTVLSHAVSVDRGPAPKWLAACELRRVRIDPGSSERGEGGG